MEISSSKITGHAVTVIFNGSNYFIYSSFYGLICNATRKGYNGDCIKTFIIEAGNEHTIGSSLTNSTIIAAAKRFITKSENKYVKCDCRYVVSSGTCENKYITVTAQSR